MGLDLDHLPRPLGLVVDCTEVALLAGLGMHSSPIPGAVSRLTATVSIPETNAWASLVKAGRAGAEDRRRAQLAGAERHLAELSNRHPVDGRLEDGKTPGMGRMRVLSARHGVLADPGGRRGYRPLLS
jgi:hypothetical protein